MSDPLIQIEVAGASKRFKVSSESDPTSCVPDKVWSSVDTIVERKLDGHRFKMHIFSTGNRFDSRRESVDGGFFVEKTDNAPLLRDLVVAELAGTVLDGELIAGKDSNSVAHALGSHATDEEKASINYVAFDIIMHKGTDVRSKPDRERRKLLESCFSQTSLGASGLVKLMVRQSGMTVQQKKNVLLDALLAGEEGVMIKDVSMPYGKGWTKVKREARFDVVVMGYDPPEQFSLKKGDSKPTETKYFKNGWIGAIKFGQFVDGKMVEFGQTSGMDETIRKAVSEDQAGHIGRVFEIAAQERFPKTGKFRHPRFLRWRDGEKLAKDCVYREDEI